MMKEKDDINKLANFSGELAKLSIEAMILIVGRLNELGLSDSNKILAIGVVIDALAERYSDFIDDIVPSSAVELKKIFRLENFKTQDEVAKD